MRYLLIIVILVLFPVVVIAADSSKAIKLTDPELIPAVAQVNIGNTHASKKNYKEALKWFKLAAEKGNSTAKFNIAGLYAGGYGVGQDNDEARKWYIKAAEGGEVRAISRFLKYYTRKKDFLRAYVWSHIGLYNDTNTSSMIAGFDPKTLAKNLSAEELKSANYLIKNWKKGDSIDFSHKHKGLSIIELAEKKAKAGDAGEYYNLGKYYTYGYYSIQKDKKKGISYYKKAAKAGSMKAQVALGNHFLTNYKEDKNVYSNKEHVDESIKWFRMAAEQGSPFAEAQMATFYFHANIPNRITSTVSATLINPDGTKEKDKNPVDITTDATIHTSLKRDADKGIEWLKKAANHGHGQAMFALGFMYAQGKNIPVDVEKSYKWMYILTLAGNDNASAIAKKIRTTLSRETIRRIESDATNHYKVIKKYVQNLKSL